MRSRLKLKGYDAATIDAIIGELTRVGQLDDVRFARLWVESRMSSNPMGDIVLRRELKAVESAVALVPILIVSALFGTLISPASPLQGTLVVAISTPSSNHNIAPGGQSPR